jgi:hypothetical protein
MGGNLNEIVWLSMCITIHSSSYRLVVPTENHIRDNIVLYICTSINTTQVVRLGDSMQRVRKDLSRCNCDFSVFNIIDKNVKSYPIEKLRIAVCDNIENF